MRLRTYLTPALCVKTLPMRPAFATLRARRTLHSMQRAMHRLPLPALRLMRANACLALIASPSRSIHLELLRKLRWWDLKVRHYRARHFSRQVHRPRTQVNNYNWKSNLHNLLCKWRITIYCRFNSACSIFGLGLQSRQGIIYCCICLLLISNYYRNW